MYEDRAFGRNSGHARHRHPGNCRVRIDRPVTGFAKPREALGNIAIETAAALIAAASDIALVVDRDGVVRDAAFQTDSLVTDLGERDRWIGRRWSDLVSLDSKPKIATILRDSTDATGLRWRQVNHPALAGPDVPVQYRAMRVDEGRIVAFGRDPGVAAELGLPVTMLGTLRDEQTLALAYSACDLLALPSRQDNLPNILAEAGGCELPAVAFDAGGVGELVLDGVTGALVPAFDVAAYGRAIVALLQQPKRRTTLGAAARAHVAAICDPARVADAYGRLFDTAVAG